jgi:hypothetical protein
VEAEERRLAAEKVKALKARREEERRETERVRVEEEARRATEASGSGAAAMIIDVDATIEAVGKSRCYACVKKGTVACIRQ